jgi:hypothetical protein
MLRGLLTAQEVTVQQDRPSPAGNSDHGLGRGRSLPSDLSEYDPQVTSALL